MGYGRLEFERATLAQQAGRGQKSQVTELRQLLVVGNRRG